MKSSNILFGIGLTFMLWGCGQANRENGSTNAISTYSDSMSEVSESELGEAKVATSPSSQGVSSSAAVENGKDTKRRFIRTAELKFEVESVIKSTYNIENITTKEGGFVTYTNLLSERNNTINTAISADSSLETTYYTVNNTITLRVPNTKLDTTLKQISNNIEYLDYRIIKADDVALQLLSNNLTQKRSATNQQRLTNAIDRRGKKLKETSEAEELLLNKQEQADNAKISNLSLTDQISFSTINLIIYQRQTIKRKLICNDKNIDAYEPSFTTKIGESLSYGGNIFLRFIVFIVQWWALILLAILVVFLYRKYAHKFK